MNGEGSEDWDADFLDQLLQVEKIALSSSSCSSASKSNPEPFVPSQPTVFSSHIPPFQHHQNSCLTHSPPRELSQRPIDFDNRFANGFSSVFHPISLPQDDAKDREIDSLKRELGHVSKKLLALEHECLELRNERNKKEEHIKLIYSHAAGKDTDYLKNTNLDCGVPSVNSHGVLQQARNEKALENKFGYQIYSATSSTKEIGVQTDKAGDSSNIDLNDDAPSSTDVSDKLLGIWGFTSDQKLGRNLISKLFMACPADFHFLFGRMTMNMSSKSGDAGLGEWSSHAALQHHMHSFHASEATKVSCLYSVLTKVSNGLLHLEALLQPLIDLCYLENVDILYSSLSILHVFLKHLFTLGRKWEKRDYFKVEGAKSGNNFKDRGLVNVSEEETSCASYRLFGTKPFYPQIPCKTGAWDVDIGFPCSSVDWVSLFYLLLQIVERKTEERVRLEAVSIMNVILLRTNASAEREIYGQAPVFTTIAQFLKKESSSCVQKEALHLLYLLLNCPKLLSAVCPTCKEGDNAAYEDNDSSNCEDFNVILEGLVDCMACSGNSIQDIVRRKRAVIMLAFLASSVKSGFKFLVNHKLPGEKNFLMLILQVLISEMDVELSVSSEPAENIKARTLLMREVLILLNRLVSNPSSSAIVLRALTASRDAASLIIDIVSRLSQKGQILRSADGITRQMREIEIVDLARGLKKRVYTYLG